MLICFSNGKVEWYEQLSPMNNPKVFSRNTATTKAQDAYTSDIGEAILDDWEILKAMAESFFS